MFFFLRLLAIYIWPQLENFHLFKRFRIRWKAPVFDSGALENLNFKFYKERKKRNNLLLRFICRRLRRRVSTSDPICIVHANTSSSIETSMKRYTFGESGFLRKPFVFFQSQGFHRFVHWNPKPNRTIIGVSAVVLVHQFSGGRELRRSYVMAKTLNKKSILKRSTNSYQN